MADKKFPCGQCGAKLEFKPGVQSLKCPYCAHEQAIPQSEEDVQELDFNAFLRDAAAKAESVTEQVVKCQTCAAEYTRDASVTSDECPYCGSPQVVEGGSLNVIKPKALLPFVITHREGQEKFKTWIKGLWFAPSKLKTYARAQNKLKGMYTPYWTYDCEATTWYTGQRGEHYWVTETYTTMENGKSVTKTRQVRKTRWYPASGLVWNEFDDVLVLASNSLPHKYAEKLEPWDLPNLTNYSDEYLSGFRAEAYHVDLEQGFGVAQGKMDPTIRSTIRSDIGGDEQRIHTTRTRWDEITFKHILLPIWISSYRFREKVYRFLINGRTGEVQGERPWSFWKIFFAVAGVLAVIGGIVAIVAAAQGG